jgi:tRNA nucleotidyltransferase/poly(A) polymerase
MPQSAAQRAFALEIVQRLRGSGYEALWAGGCVRDELLGKVPKDYDVATSALPDQIRDLFGRRRTLAIGASFGVITVIGPRTAGQIDVATFRSDAAYSDGRHPDSVTFTTAERDAARRDFTINGLFFDPLAERVVDYVGGQEDLKRRIVRAIGDPRSRFGEDKLRMLRAVRFAAAFEFEIDSDTANAIGAMADAVTSVSAERIGAEIRRMLVDVHRADAIELLRLTKLLPHVLPEVDRLDDMAFDEIKRRLCALVEPTLSLALATLISSGPESGPQHPKQPSGVNALGRRLRFTNKEIDRAAWLLRHVPSIADAPELPWPQLQRLLIDEGAAELVALREAVAGLDDPAAGFCRERLAWPAERLNPAPLIGGNDLVARGLAPGPEFAPLLEKIRDAQLNGEIRTPAEALALVDRMR